MEKKKQMKHLNSVKNIVRKKSKKDIRYHVLKPEPKVCYYLLLKNEQIELESSEDIQSCWMMDVASFLNELDNTNGTD